MSGILIGLGLGPGDPSLLTYHAGRELEAADLVIVPIPRDNAPSRARRTIDAFFRGMKKPPPRVDEEIFPMSRDESVIEKAVGRVARRITSLIREGRRIVFAVEGDPTVYSTFGRLLDACLSIEPDLPFRIVPGVSIITAAAAALGMTIADGKKPFSVLPSPNSLGRVREALLRGEAVVILKPSSSTVISEILDEARGLGREIGAVHDLGGEGEIIGPPPEEEIPYHTTIVIGAGREAQAEGIVEIVGGGPGSADLITVRGRRLLDEADLVIYTGSILDKGIVEGIRADLIDSASMTLDEILDTIEGAVKGGKRVVRLHTGDPSIYGALHEEVNELSSRDIPYRVTPGVTASFAAAAAMGKELTVPGLTQTVVITRIPGRTPVPEAEAIENLASTGATLVIYLSASKGGEISRRLSALLPPETPAAIVADASLPSEKIIPTRLSELGRVIEVEGIKGRAVIIVGRALEPPHETGRDYRSRLYDPTFTHGARG